MTDPRRSNQCSTPRSRPLAVTGLAAPLVVRESVRARRMTLRVNPAQGVIELVVPPGRHETEALGFIQRHAGWIRSRLAALPPARPFADGAQIPVLGVDHLIRHEPERRGPGCRQDGILRVGGRLEHLTRRVRDTLIAEARVRITEQAQGMAASLGTRVRGISLRDTRSRWGSCSASGRLSFSWRLMLCPEPVLSYVIAHEVAHLLEMNHGPRFWSLVGRLCPDVVTPRSWLRRHGAELLRIG